MEAMLVTSDVSKLLSVWLNAYANCRVTTQGEGVQCGASAGREAEELLGASVAAQSGVHGEGPTQGLGGRARAHREHGAHVRDLGGVEHAEWLVELSSHLPSRKEGTRCGPGWPGGS